MFVSSFCFVMGAEVEDGVHAVVDKIMVRWSFGSIQVRGSGSAG
jgi:hypothetical protein